MKTNLKSHLFDKHVKTYIGQSVCIALVVLSFIFIGWFCPDFIFNFPNAKTPNGSNYSGSLGNYIFSNYILFSSNPGLQTAGSLRLIFTFGIMVLTSIASFVSFRYVFYFITFKPGFEKYLNTTAEIINSCDINKISAKVALVVETRNDFTPSTVLQTIKQTYKNIDVWLLDDSSKPESIQEVQNFANQYNCFVLRRPDEHKKQHPTMIGNLMFFVQTHGSEYDYICETGASTIITSTFIQNGLCFFNSELLNDVNLGAIGGCGSFYPINTLFGYLTGKSTQFADAHCNAGGSFRTSGTNMYVNGGASLYKSSVLQSIPLHMVECPSCDVARSFGMSQHNLTCLINPYDFTGKLVTQNIYRFNNQRLKGCGGDAFIFKRYGASHYDYKLSGFYVKSHYFMIIITFIGLFVFTILDNLLTICCHNLTYINLTSIIIIACIAAPLGIGLIIACWYYKSNFGLLIITVLNGMFELAIIFKKMYALVVTSLIRGKGSSGAVTVKTTEKVDARKWGQFCRFDIIGLVVSLSLCIALTLTSIFVGKNVFFIAIVGFNIFTFIALPSILGLISTIFIYIHTKSGWSDDKTTFDIAANDFRFKYVKETALGKKQHDKDNI